MGAVKSQELHLIGSIPLWFMNVYSKVPEYGRLAIIPVLSKKARHRLKWFDYYKSHHQNTRLTCHYFGISPQTFNRWKRRYDPYHMEGLGDRSCRIQRVRQPTCSTELVVAVQRLAGIFLFCFRSRTYYQSP